MEPFNQSENESAPSLLEKIVGQSVAHSHVSSGPKLYHAIQELSQLFTRERQSLPADYLEHPAYAAAYLSYFLPVNAAKVQTLLSELPIETEWNEKQGEPFAVLDLGSGPGTTALAVIDWMAKRFGSGVSLCVRAVDRSATALKTATGLWEHYSREAGVRQAVLKTHCGDVEKFHKGSLDKWAQSEGPYDLIALGNSLNELYRGAEDAITPRAGLIGRLLALLKPQGSIMIIEPALKQVSRELHQVRDQLVLSKQCTVYSPCLHEQACPALVRADDWCHEERPWEPPATIRAIDKEVGFIKDSLKFSYLLLRKDGRRIVTRQPDVYRVVSELMVFKGEKRAWLCNELGRSEVGRQDRLRSDANAPFDDWHRGAIVQIERIVRKEKQGKVSALGRIEPDAAVKIVRPV
jgi:ribosomal protein RSM22 (predicted rRNA methylase)